MPSASEIDILVIFQKPSGANLRVQDKNTCPCVIGGAVEQNPF